MARALRALVVDDSATIRTVVANMLRERGYEVETVDDAHIGATRAIATRPDVVLTDLWMPGLSGIQLCRLLRAEPATAGVPVVLITSSAEKRTRFWAEHAGALGVVDKARVATELPRVLQELHVRNDAEPESHRDGSPGAPHAPTSIRGDLAQAHAKHDVSVRLARLLDGALYESVVASEVRALANAGSVKRVFQGLGSLLSQLTTFRWVALTTTSETAPLFVVHGHPDTIEAAAREARAAMRDEAPPAEFVAAWSADASCVRCDPEELAVPAHVERIGFGGVWLGTLAYASDGALALEDEELVRLVANELGGPLQMALLVESTRRLASTDMLTGMMNRRAFCSTMERELARAQRHGTPLSMILLDVDRFKSVNDVYGHAAGDAVLAHVGKILSKTGRRSDIVGRWGGEEFVIALPHCDGNGARVAAERLRGRLESTPVVLPNGQPLAVTASFGVATFEPGEPLDAIVARADRAMYSAKNAGRNRVAFGDTAAA